MQEIVANNKVQLSDRCVLVRERTRPCSLGDLGEGLGLVLDPAVVVGSDVVPSGLELVADGPHEVALDSPVEDVEHALTKAHDLVISIEGGVDGAGSILDG